MKRRWYMWLLMAAFILWIGVIWCFSMQNSTASSGVSNGILRKILHLFQVTVDSSRELELELILRKTAHMAEFAILAILSASAFQSTGGMHPVYKAHAACIAVAIIDEVHQLFVPGRTGLVNDVVIDIIGACAGLFLFVLVRMYIRSRKSAGD